MGVKSELPQEELFRSQLCAAQRFTLVFGRGDIANGHPLLGGVAFLADAQDTTAMLAQVAREKILQRPSQDIEPLGVITDDVLDLGLVTVTCRAEGSLHDAVVDFLLRRLGQNPFQVGLYVPDLQRRVVVPGGFSVGVHLYAREKKQLPMPTSLGNSMPIGPAVYARRM